MQDFSTTKHNWLHHNHHHYYNHHHHQIFNIYKSKKKKKKKNQFQTFKLISITATEVEKKPKSNNCEIFLHWSKIRWYFCRIVKTNMISAP